MGFSRNCEFECGSNNDFQQFWIFCLAMSHFSLIYLRQSWSSSRFYVTSLDFEILGQASWFRVKMTVLNSLISKILALLHEIRRFYQNFDFKIEKFILEMSKNVNKRGSVIKTRREVFLIWSRLDIEQYKFVFSFWWNTCHLSYLTSWHDQVTKILRWVSIDSLNRQEL